MFSMMVTFIIPSYEPRGMSIVVAIVIRSLAQMLCGLALTAKP